ncbi:hypothetical protein F7734_43235 [Scytonema sp. UIC 10036]|uniref:helix-turn-helix domain-containing protein n=1 Tax=Scytonema sp. UIC 10036 TaxID=2304196 RepID=UPI0012DA4545|nr:helix-turn-helix domain-containing protein [Scytonema sp. UIC 10036]MUG98748.1 hypothetical protein [Scytonema sp. UIC 10036]
MKNSKKAKELAWKLYQQKETSDSIAVRCKVSRRTVQRWFKEFEQTPIIITGKGETPESEDFQANTVTALSLTTPLPILERIANLEPGETLDLTISSRMAIRLLNLAEIALATVEDCLTNSDIKPSDRLKAAQIVGQWVGLDDKDRRSIIAQVALTCGADLETVNIEKSSAIVKSRDVLSAQWRLNEEQRQKQAASKERIRKYNDEIYENFWRTQTLPDSLSQDFDINYFLNSLECDSDDSEDYKVYQQAVKVLRSRGYQC